MTFLDRATGKRVHRRRRADSYSDAEDVAKAMLTELNRHDRAALDHRTTTFDEFADQLEKPVKEGGLGYLVEAKFVHGKKIKGLRSVRSARGFLKVLREKVGHRRLREITYHDIASFKERRLETATRGDVARHKEVLKGNPKAKLVVTRSFASINRELSLLRKTLNIALRQKMILSHPFLAGDSLVSAADERKRERILTIEEEQRLLKAACANTRRGHLKQIIITALDTGMRKGEILKMRWKDVDFENSMIIIQSFNAKTQRERKVAMTARLASELEQLWKASDQDSEALVFGITDDVKRSFSSARAEAGLPDVRFHDLRHTVATRLVSRHIELAEVGKLLGHNQPSTTYRYVNPNEQTARLAAEALESFNPPADPTAIESNSVN